MKNLLSRYFLVSFLMAAACLLALPGASLFAKDVDDMGFKKDVPYDIYYEVGSYAVDRVRDVKIVRKMGEGSLTFLVIEGGTGLQGKEGYILLDKIRAILPSGYIHPKRVVDVDSVGATVTQVASS